MSWSQDYSVESLLELLEKLTGRTAEQSLTQELENQGIKIIKTEQIVLEDDMFIGQIHGLRVELSDGRVFVHKLTRSETANGNWGCDTYDLVLESENPEVVVVDSTDGDITYPNDENCTDSNCGCER